MMVFIQAVMLGRHEVSHEGIWLSEGGIERTNSISSAKEWWENLSELAMSDDFTKWFGVKKGMSADPFGTTIVEL